MLTRLLIASAVATLAVSGVDARLRATDMGPDYFEVQGLEQLETRYGSAFPGYAGANYAGASMNLASGGAQQQAVLGLGATEQAMLLGNSGVYQNMANQAHTLGLSNVNTRLGVTGVAAPVTQTFGWSATSTAQAPQNWAQSFGDIGTEQFGNIGGIDSANMQFGNIAAQQPIISQQMLGNVGLQQQQQQRNINLGVSNVDMVNLQQPVTLAQIPQIQQSSVSTVMPNYQAPLLGSGGVQNFGGIGTLGAAPAGGASKKTTTAQPIYAQSMVVPKIITQPIYRPHSVTQPIVQQQLIQQPIVETRQVIQPVIRRIITQPIIRPEIYESTTIQPTLKTETVVQPHIVQQTVVTPQLQNEYSEQAPIQEKPKSKVQPAQVQAVQSQKKSSGAGGLGLGVF